MKALSREQWLYCLQIGLSMMLAYLVTHGSDPANAIYAVMGAGLVTTPSVGEGIGVSKERLIGTLLGALVSLPAAWLQNPALALGLTVVVIAPLGMMLGGVAITRIGVTMAAVTVVLHTDTVSSYAFLRFTNTVAGVAVALIVSFMLWPFSSRQSFSGTLSASVRASAKLAEQMATPGLPAFPMEGQKGLFAALSSIPKALNHMLLDPLLYRRRSDLRRESQLVVSIGIDLLAASITLGRKETLISDAERAVLQAALSQIAERLHQVRRGIPDAEASPVSLAPPENSVPSPGFAQVIEELRAIEGWIDELDAVMHRQKETRS